MDKYFSYRRRYVDYVLAEAPHRAALAVVAELTRLAFVFAGNALCAAIFWSLAVASLERSGLGFGWPAWSLLLAALPTLFGLLTVRGLATALGDRQRVDERLAVSAKSRRA